MCCLHQGAILHSGRPRQRRRSRAESTSSGFCFGRRHRSSAEPLQPSRVCSCTRGARRCWNPRPRHKLLNRQCWKIYISIKLSQTWVRQRPLLIYPARLQNVARIWKNGQNGRHGAGRPFLPFRATLCGRSEYSLIVVPFI